MNEEGMGDRRVIKDRKIRAANWKRERFNSI